MKSVVDSYIDLGEEMEHDTKQLISNLEKDYADGKIPRDQYLELKLYYDTMLTSAQEVQLKEVKKH